MSRRKGSNRKRSSRKLHIHKANGVLHPRVQKVGPERFGIVSVDPAKSRSKWMLADYYGEVLSQPQWVENNAQQLQTMVDSVRRERTAAAADPQAVGRKPSGA